MNISDKVELKIVEKRMIKKKKKSMIVIYGRKENTNSRDLRERTENY